MEEKMEGVQIPYYLYESAMARAERAQKEAAQRHETAIKRLIWAVIVAVVLLCLTNAAWLVAWIQYDYAGEETVYTQDGEGLNIIGDGNEASIDGTDID